MFNGIIAPVYPIKPTLEVVYMAKNPNNKPKKAVKQDQSSTLAMKFLVTGFLAWLYLMIVRNNYVNGYAEQQIAWYDVYLKGFIFGGVAVLAVGAVLAHLWRQKKNARVYGWLIGGFGAFVAVASGLMLWNMALLPLLTSFVVVVMALGIVWSLYDRESALSLTLLGVSLFAVWVCRGHLNSIYSGTFVKIGVIALIAVMIAVAVLVKRGKLISDKAGLPVVYTACGLSVVALAVSLLGSVIAYYTMWVLAIVVFGLAVYYTIKQL
jgi:hypothetical protein